MKLYGLKNCDSCRKALKDLRAAGYAPELVEVRTAPVPAELMAKAFAQFEGMLLNKASTTWRALTEEEKAYDVLDLLARYPNLMKRPLIVKGDKMTLGWKADVRAQYGA